jgi:DNA primase
LRGAPVAAPVAWKEVADRRLRPDGFSMRDALERPDRWAGFRKAARSPLAVAKKLGVATGG